mmetsp:Transcript_6785/g.19208  ORF Transcript_6785/g.19208 Transcript_6785/m.19208 type:complete len:653 (+) Transcript_6785:257-2215(+)
MSNNFPGRHNASQWSGQGTTSQNTIGGRQGGAATGGQCIAEEQLLSENSAASNGGGGTRPEADHEGHRAALQGGNVLDYTGSSRREGPTGAPRAGDNQPGEHPGQSSGSFPGDCPVAPQEGNYPGGSGSSGSYSRSRREEADPLIMGGGGPHPMEGVQEWDAPRGTDSFGGSGSGPYVAQTGGNPMRSSLDDRSQSGSNSAPFTSGPPVFHRTLSATPVTRQLASRLEKEKQYCAMSFHRDDIKVEINATAGTVYVKFHFKVRHVEVSIAVPGGYPSEPPVIKRVEPQYVRNFHTRKDIRIGPLEVPRLDFWNDKQTLVSFIKWIEKYLQFTIYGVKSTIHTFEVTGEGHKVSCVPKTQSRNLVISLAMSAEGSLRRAFSCYTYPEWVENICKCSKRKADESEYKRDVKVQTIAQIFGRWFNDWMDGLVGKGNYRRIEFIDSGYFEFRKMDRYGHMKKVFFAIEPLLQGSFIKWTNNYKQQGGPNIPDELPAFSHFVYEYSGHKYMIVDLQGIAADGRFLLTDPQLHAPDKKDLKSFGAGNLGPTGIRAFFDVHDCSQNPFCREMNYKKPTRADLAYLPPAVPLSQPRPVQQNYGNNFRGAMPGGGAGAGNAYSTSRNNDPYGRLGTGGQGSDGQYGQPGRSYGFGGFPGGR